MPSSSVSSAATTRSVTPESKLWPRRGASASTSSRNTSDGAESLARRNNSRTAFSEAPTHLSISSEPLTACTLSCPVLASARTTKVLPQPGGPYSSTPRGGSMPSRAKVSGCCNGHSTASVSACLASAMSPTSSSVTLPTVSSSLPDRDSGRITVSAPTRSSWFSVGGLAVGAGPRRRAQRRLAHQCGQVGDDETRCAAGDFVEIEIAGRHRLEQRLQQRLAGGGVGQRQAQLPVARVGGAQPGIELVGSRGGGDQRDALGGHRGAQLAQDQRGHRLGGGRQQRVDIGDQQHAAAVANPVAPPRPRL